jgi:ATPase subunit of ABC transporter with duplicated ATPase domains
MAASDLAKEQLLNENAKKSAEIQELQSFVARFSANASKAKQATSRARRLEKIELEEVIPSSRQSPYLVYKQHKKLHRLALELHDVSHGFEGETLFTGGDILIEAGAKLAVIGENGAGKTTFLRCLVGELQANKGIIKWSENASIGYLAQDVSSDFAESMTLFDWMSQWRTPKHDDLAVRAILGQLLFSSDDVKKDVKVCSGGEKNRLLFGKLMMQEINVIIMDEPTNHMDMEAIEALNKALQDFDGTLITVSHDREFVSSLANQIIEIKDNQLHYFQGTYDEYMSGR